MRLDDLELLPIVSVVDTDRLRRQIETPRMGYLWGQKAGVFTPRLLDKVWGDGRRLFAVYPIFQRPKYVAARVGSSVKSLVDEDEHGHCVIDAIYDAAEDQFGRCHCRDCDEDDDEPYPECDGFPADADWGGGSSWSALDWPDLVEASRARRRYKERHLLPWRASGRIGSTIAGAANLWPAAEAY